MRRLRKFVVNLILLQQPHPGLLQTARSSGTFCCALPNVYCCRKANDDTTDCCHDSTKLITKIPPIDMPIVQATVETNSTTSNSTMSNSTTSNTTSPLGAVSSSNQVAVVGAGVGASLGVCLLAALVTIFVLFRKQTALKRELAYARDQANAGSYAQNPYQGYSHVPDQIVGPQYQPQPPRAEKDSQNPSVISEMDGSRRS